jgi:hypothetical protein
MAQGSVLLWWDRGFCPGSLFVMLCGAGYFGSLSDFSRRQSMKYATRQSTVMAMEMMSWKSIATSCQPAPNKLDDMHRQAYRQKAITSRFFFAGGTAEAQTGTKSPCPVKGRG